MSLSALHPWTFGWDALVAIGTLALAGVTVALGAVAVLGNRHARRAVAVAEAELRASMFPLLEAVPVQLNTHRDNEPMWPIDYTSVGGIDLPERLVWRDEVDFFGNVRGVFFSIPIQNVGRGVARISEKPRALSPPDVRWTEGDATRALLPAGEGARLNFRLNGARDEIYAEVLYSDIGGEQGTRTRFYLRRESDGSGHPQYPVRGTAMYQPFEAGPIAAVGDPKVTVRQPTTP